LTKNHPSCLPAITGLLSQSHQIHPLSFTVEKKVITEKNEQGSSFYLSRKHLRIYVQKESAGHTTVSRAELANAAKQPEHAEHLPKTEPMLRDRFNQ